MIKPAAPTPAVVLKIAAGVPKPDAVLEIEDQIAKLRDRRAALHQEDIGLHSAATIDTRAEFAPLIAECRRELATVDVELARLRKEHASARIVHLEAMRIALGPTRAKAVDSVRDHYESMMSAWRCIDQVDAEYRTCGGGDVAPKTVTSAQAAGIVQRLLLSVVGSLDDSWSPLRKVPVRTMAAE